MREIKFRAYEEIGKMMHNEFRFIKTGEEGNDWIVFVSDKQPLDSKPHPFENPHFSQQFKIMQCTGLKDKNGVEIYEGDVLELKWLREKVYRGAIEFHDGRFVLCHDTGLTVISMAYQDSSLVIGNIHENHYLLEPK